MSRPRVQSLIKLTYWTFSVGSITGVFLILIGEALILSVWAIGIWAIVFLIINMFYFPLSEEPGLRKRFGKEYEEYCKNVPRYIPRFTPWKPVKE